jgi:hypothetical protein
LRSTRTCGSGATRVTRRVGVGPPLGQWPQGLAFLDEAIDGAAAQRAMAASVGLLTPAVELVLTVALVGERAAGLEVRAQVAAAVLDQPLGLGVARLEDQVAHRELAAKARIGLGGAPAAGVQRALAV